MVPGRKEKLNYDFAKNDMTNVWLDDDTIEDWTHVVDVLEAKHALLLWRGL